MFEFKITCLMDAQTLISQDWPTRIVSFIDPVTKWPAKGAHHLVLRAEDVPIAEWSSNPPSYDHLKQTLAFTADLKDHDRLLVHCFAGQSRSTALMVAILIQHGLAADAAFAKVVEHREIALPNKLMISYADAHFGLGGALVEINDARHSEQLSNKDRFKSPERTPAEALAEMKRIMNIMLGDGKND